VVKVPPGAQFLGLHYREMGRFTIERLRHSLTRLTVRTHLFYFDGARPGVVAPTAT